MTAKITFLTHADVVIDPDVPVPDWGLSPAGHARHAAFAQAADLSAVTAVYASTERKAREGAAPLADALGLTVRTHAGFGENDRSATGFLPPDAFWPVVEAFFADPDTSIHGWETARAAQTRILSALRDTARTAPEGDTIVVSHGGVGALLRCALLSKDITRAEDQPHPKGGCWFEMPRSLDGPPTEWRTI